MSDAVVIARANARLCQIEMERAALDFEQSEIETFLAVMERLSGPHPELAFQPQPVTPAAQLHAVDDGVSPSLAGAEGSEDRHPILSQRVIDKVYKMFGPAEAAGDPVDPIPDEPAPPPPAIAEALSPTPTASASISRSRKRMVSDALAEARTRTPLQQRILDARAEHPEWNAAEMARHTGIGYATIKYNLKALKLALPKGEGGRKAGAQVPGRPTRSEQIRAVLAEHPDWHAQKIAAQLGCPVSTIHATASAAKIVLPKMADAERSARIAEGVRAGAANKQPRKPVEAPKPVAAPKPQPEREPAPASSAEPVASPFAPIETGDVRKIKRPKGTRFRLRDRESGLYLHQDLRAMNGELKLVGLKEHPWQGTGDQLKAVRKMLPATWGLSETVVEKA